MLLLGRFTLSYSVSYTQGQPCLISQKLNDLPLCCIPSSYHCVALTLLNTLNVEYYNKSGLFDVARGLWCVIMLKYSFTATLPESGSDRDFRGFSGGKIESFTTICWFP